MSHRADAWSVPPETQVALVGSTTETGGIAMTESTESFIKAESEDFIRERRAPHVEDNHLMANTDNWLNALPKGVRPVQLQTQFPRIANDLCRLWPEISLLDSYFTEKELSPRPDRRGFPPLIKEELLAMHVYSLRNRPRTYK